LSTETTKQGYKLVTNFFRHSIEIPTDWEYPKFHEVVKTNPLTKITEKNVPYIPMDAVHVSKPHFDYTEERIFSEHSGLPKFQENDVLFARITPSTENGKTCIIENFSKKGIASSELTVLRPTKSVFPKYLYYYVKNHRLRQFAISQMMGSTGRQRVPDYVFKKDLSFELPSLQEQQKISSILSNVDNLISSYDKVIAHTKHLKQGLTKHLLTIGIGHKKFKKVKWYFGKYLTIPDSWKILKIEENVQKIMKGIFDMSPENYVQNGIPFLRISDIEDNNLVLENCVYIPSELSQNNPNSKLHSNDLVLAKVGSIYSNDKITIIPKTVSECNISQNIIGIKTDPTKMNPKYLLLELQRNYHILVSFSNSTTLGALRLDVLRNLKIPVPPLPEQEKITSKLSEIDSKISALEYKMNSLKFIKKGLMQKLLTGKIRV